MRTLVAALAMSCMLALLGGRVARADARTDVQAKVKAAMESYDNMDYDAARKTLTQAVAAVKKGKLDKDPLAARVYLDQGIVAFAVPDLDAAKVAFQSAVQIDPKIQIDAAYRSADMVKLLDEARGEAAGGGGPGDEMGNPGVDCASVHGLQHNLLDNAKANSAAAIEAFVGSDLSPAKVSLMYRAEGATDFTEVKMTKQGCKYSASIPPAGTHGSVVHYYVAAYDASNKVIAGKGSAGSPNIIELSGGGGTKVEDEDPLGGGGKKSGGGDDSGGGVSAHVDGKPSPAHVMLTVAAGTGLGYVTGTTENMSQVKNCCIGNSLFVLTPELDIMVGPQLSVGVAARLGFPLDANIDGHATLAPAALLRVRYALADSGEGVRVTGQIGAGIIRNTLKIDNPKMNGQDTDIVAQGPLLIGGGIGWSKHLASKVVFLVDASALAGIAVTSSFGSAPALNSGVTLDITAGFAVGI